MPRRPTWSGSIQISLISIAVKIFPATNPGKQVEFHQIDRKTHKRVHHQNVDEAGEVEKADLVKGFEYAKNKYIEIDPEELKALSLPTTMPIKQFIKAEELSPGLFDRPYFVVSISKSCVFASSLRAWLTCPTVPTMIRKPKKGMSLTDSMSHG